MNGVIKQKLLPSFYFTKNLRATGSQIKAKKSLLVLLFVLFFNIGAAFSQVTVTNSNIPENYIPLGDSVTFTATVLSGTPYTNSELEVKVPAGFEILPSTPHLKNLSSNKTTARIVIPSLTAYIASDVQIYVKVLCDAQTATDEANRIVKYSFYSSASAPIATTTAQTSPIVDFRIPILNVTYPESKNVSIGSSEVRVFKFVQTRNYSHINNLKVVATCNRSGFSISKIEVSHNKLNWIDITASALTQEASGYAYTLTQNNTFIPLGYSNKQLGYSDSLFVRETVSLLTCGEGNVNYNFYSGDGTIFCSSLANNSVTYSEPLYGYSPDIFTQKHIYPTSPSNDGYLVFGVKNGSLEAEAVMHDIYVNVYGGGLTYKTAFISDINGNPILWNSNQVDINWTGTQLKFDQFNDASMTAYYTARGLSDLDGDGVYNDLKKGNVVYFTVKYNYIINTGSCPAALKEHTTRRADLYYKTFCKNNYILYTRDYTTGDSGASSIGSTNAWQGGVAYSSLRDVSVSNSNLTTGAATTLSLRAYYSGNGTVPGVSGSNLISLATTGTAATSNIPTSDFWTTVVLPDGLSFDDTNVTSPLKINSTNIPSTSYNVSLDKKTVRIKWTANWSANNYTIRIPVIANGNSDTDKTLEIYHEYDYGKTGTIQKFGCASEKVGYVQIEDCSGLQLVNFDAQRTVFGYADGSKSERVTTTQRALELGFNLDAAGPHDNVSMTGTAVAKSNLLLANAVLNVEFKHNKSFNVTTSAFGVDPEKGNNAVEIFYNNSGTPIKIPSSAISYSKSSSNIHTHKVDIAGYLRTAGINQLNINDELKIVFYTRVSTSVSNIVETASVPVEMNIAQSFNNTAINCSPLMEIMKLFDYNWQNKTGSSGGTNGYTLPQAWNHYSSTNVSAMDLGITWSMGGTNPFTATAGVEYRPNGDNFTDVITEYPFLMHVNIARAVTSNKIAGSFTANANLPTSDYSVSYQNGKTYVTFNNLSDMMSTVSSSGPGYNVNMDVINYNNVNASGTPLTMNKSISYSYDMYPTSSAPQRYTANRLATSDQANGGTTIYPYKYQITPLSTNTAPMGSRAEWTLRITNQSNFLASNAMLPHSWIAVECPTGVLPVELIDVSTNTSITDFVKYADNKYWIQLGTITANSTKDYILSCTYAVCSGTPQLTVKYGMSKMDYPQDPDNGYAQAPYNSPGVLAGVVSTKISYTPPVTKFSGRLVHRPNSAANTNQFCDTVGFVGEFSNGLESRVSMLQLVMDLPLGFDYDQAYCKFPKVKFGNSGAWVNAKSVNQLGRKFTITLDNTKELTAYGTEGDKAYVDFQLRISCGMENGMQVPAQFIGQSGCGAITIEKTNSVAPLKIFGLTPPPDYWIENLNLTQTIYVGNDNTTNGSMTLSGQYRLAGAPSTGVKAIIDLPNNLKLTGTNGVSLGFTQEGTRLMVDLPNSGTIGTSTYSFNLVLKPENPEQWSADSTLIYVRTGKVNEMNCDGFTCPMLEMGQKYDSVTVIMKKLEVDFSPAISAESRYNDSSSERVVIKGSLINKNDVNAGRLTMELMYFDGVEYHPVNDVISGLTVAGVTANSSTSFTINANVRYTENICNMVLMLRRAQISGSVNAYLSDSVAIVIPIPRYRISAVVDNICQMTSNVEIGELPITDYQYAWTPADYLSKNNIARPYFSYDYENNPLPNDTVLEYLIEIKRPNQCTSVDTLRVPVKGIPYVQDIADMTLCSDSPFYIEFKDTTDTRGATIFNWKIENGPNVGLPASGNKPIINVASVRNNTTQPVVLHCLVTPRKNGCDGITKSFYITINPKVQINTIVEQSYCNNEQVASHVLSGNLSNAVYRWEHVSGDAISGLTSGKNFIPKFLAINNTTVPITGNFIAYAEYENAGTICYSDTVHFNITIEPSPIVNTVGDIHICSGEDLSIVFSGTSVEKYYWNRVSGSSIQGLASSGEGNINVTAITNTTANPISAVYKVLPTRSSGACSGIEDNFTITVYPKPILTSTKTPKDICSGSTFEYTATSSTKELTYNWKRLPNAGIQSASSTGNTATISETLINTTETPVTVKYEYTLTQGTYCPKLDTISVTVNPQTDFVLLNTQNTICSGAVTSIDLDYNTNNNISNLLYEITYSDIAKANGFTNVAPTVVPSGSIPALLPANTAAGTYTGVLSVYFVSAPNCKKEYSFTIHVNPLPVLNNEKNYTICSGSPFVYTAASSLSGVSYVWTREAVSGISNPARTDIQGSNINETLSSTTNLPVDVIYSIEMTTSNECKKTDTLIVTVYPKPVLNNTPTTTSICSGTAYEYTSPASNVASAAISWQRLPVTGIAEGISSGTGSISEVLTNTTANPVLVYYEFTLEADGCFNTQTISITVNPSPELSSALYMSPICSGGAVNYVARTSSKNIKFSWTRSAIAGINSGVSGSGTSSLISENLINSTTNSINVQYVIKMEVSGTACYSEETVEIVVNPTPEIEAKTIDDICSGESFVYSITSATENANFTWIRPKNNSIIESASTGNTSMISETLTIKSGVTTPVTVNYIIYTEANGCRNTGETISVVVNPLPEVSIISPTPVMLAVNNTKMVEASTTGTVVGWSSSNIGIVEVTQSTPNTKAQLLAKGEGIAQITLEVMNTAGCTNRVTFTVNVNSENTATMSLADGAFSQLCNDDYTMLQMLITGGKAPFKVVYNNGSINNDTISINSSNGKFIITPPQNTGNAVETTTYTLISVTDAENQNVTIISSSVDVQVNPTAKITNAATLSSTACEGTIMSIPKFATNIADINKVSYMWFNDNPSIGLPVSGTGHLPTFRTENGSGSTITATISAVATYRGLTSCQDLNEEISFTITVYPKPDFVVINPEAICSGASIDLNAKANEILHDITPSNVTIEFFTSRSCDPSTKVTSAVSPTQTTTYYTRLTSDDNCISEVKEVVVTVNPIPVADVISDQVICNNSGLEIQLTGSLQGTTYEWKRIDSETNIIGLAASGTNVIYSYRLNNATTEPKTAVIEVTPRFTANGVTCIGSPVKFNVTVNPNPVLSVALQAPGICSGSNPMYALSSSTSGVNIIWERLDNESIVESTQEVTSNTIDETLTNLTQKTINVRYAITMELDGCSNMQYITIPVYPTPELKSSLHAGNICSGESFKYQSASAVIGSTMQWKRLDNTAINEIANASFATMPISEVLTNTTADPIVVQYEVKTTANGCENTQIVEVVVGPQLELTSSAYLGVFCSGEPIVYTATSSSSNIQYTWVRKFNANIEPMQAAGTGKNISEILYNTSNARETIEYVITMTTSNQCVAEYTITAEVCPVPDITISETSVTIAAGATRILTVTDIHANNATVTSSNPAVATVNFNPTTLELTVNTLQAGYAEIKYTTHCDNFCENNNIIPVYVTSGPMGTLSMASVSTVCSEGSTDLQITNIEYGKAPWEVEINYNGGDASSAITLTVNSLMDLPKIVSITLPSNTGNTYATYNYSITKITDSEGSIRTNHMGKPAVTVLPVPKVNAINNQEICNESKSEVVYFSGVATNYKWEVDTPIGIDMVGDGNKLPAYSLSHGNSNPVTATITITPEYTMNGLTCYGSTEQFTITVNPIPTVNPVMNEVSCHGSTISIPLTGNNSTEYHYTAATLIGLNTAGIVTAGSTLDFTANNLTHEVVSQEITVTPVYKSTSNKECYGEPITFKVTVNPKPTVNPVNNMEFCTGVKVDAIEFNGSTQGATYTWTKISGDNIMGLPNSGTGKIPAFIAYNLTSTAIVTEYEVIATINNLGNTCGDNKQTFKITIHPEPIINYTIGDQSYCAGTMTNPISFGSTSEITYDWKQTGGYNIGLTPNNGSDNIPAFVVVNNTSFVQTAVIEVTPRVRNTACVGTPMYFTIEVKPTAKLTSPIDNGNICSGETFEYEATSTSSNVYYKWRRLVNADINGGAEKQGQGYSIKETLTNTSLSQIEVQYEFNLEYEGCQSLDTITVLVDPMPVFEFEFMNYVCWNAGEVVIPYTTPQVNIPHEYKLSFTAEGHKVGFFDMAAYELLPNELKIQLPMGVASGRYTVIISVKTYSCIKNYTFVIWVNDPITIVEQPQSITGICNEGSILELSVVATGDDLTYQWYHNDIIIPEATSETYNIDYESSMAGKYYVEISNQCETVRSKTAEIVPNEVVVELMWDDVLFVNNGKGQYVKYQWYKDDVAVAIDGNNEYYSDPKGLDGKYHVVCFYTDGNYTISCPSYFVYVSESNQVVITPNPASIEGVINVQIDNYEQAQIIEIYDTSGKKVSEFTVKDINTEIKAPNIPGTYIIRVLRKGKNADQKIIVK